MAAQSLIASSDVNTLFGPDSALDDAHAGAIAFGDANLLLIPIRSFAGTVAYATCPFILRQYKRDNSAKVDGLQIPELAGSDDDTVSARVTANSSLIVGDTGCIALEDLDIKAYDNDSIQKWADAITESVFPENTKDYEDWRKQVSRRFVILPDDIFLSWQIQRLKYALVFVSIVRRVLYSKAHYGQKKTCLPIACFGVSSGLVNLAKSQTTVALKTLLTYYQKKKSKSR